MKYLKKFNESIELELQDFCEMYLAYLLDEGFEVKVKPAIFEYHVPSKKDRNVGELVHKDYFEITIDKNRKKFNLNEIKDKFIPFLKFLSDKYEIKEQIFFGINWDYFEINIEDLIKDNLFEIFTRGKYERIDPYEKMIEWIEIKTIWK
jgi:hypothetical protein